MGFAYVYQSGFIYGSKYQFVDAEKPLRIIITICVSATNVIKEHDTDNKVHTDSSKNLMKYVDEAKIKKFISLIFSVYPWCTY